jgi:hypothetical protein
LLISGNYFRAGNDLPKLAKCESPIGQDLSCFVGPSFGIGIAHYPPTAIIAAIVCAMVLRRHEVDVRPASPNESPRHPVENLLN